MNANSVDHRAEAQVMRAARIVAILFLLLAASCAAVKPPAPVATPQTAAPQATGDAVVPAGAPVGPQGPRPPTVLSQGGVAPAAPATPPARPPTTPSAGQSAAKAAGPIAKAPAKAPASLAPPAQAPRKESIAPDVAKQKSPSLDVASLEQRLKDTKAIGVLTKITLKNQVDDLLNQLRAFYQGKLKTTLAELRQPYDLLVLKVLSLLQDSDPTLAAAIVASREAIWAVLADPAKFATI